MRNKTPVLVSVAHVLVLCAVVMVSSAAFLENTGSIGFVLVLLGLASLASLKFFKIRVLSTGPDVIFGIIDNGILAVMAIVGGRIAGVAGAIAGGVVGNAVTDGIAGLFEGYLAEKMTDDHRTILGAAVGKMAGCLLGAGIVLISARFFFQ